ncbi:unnamed protein product [Psylliodes chrysocephalus]|uniref:Uncharacterized protein n=1 Tax=Psylliodes chrysocephalus TaxID=3402493 RepID=A0A9P0GDD6_9CUCU|nr:unnamed protein product [Psylliodes chrysocephala]
MDAKMNENSDLSEFDDSDADPDYQNSSSSSEKQENLENQKRKSNLPDLQEPNQLYHSPIPLPKEKCADLKVLMKFCEEEGSKEHYSQLLSANRPVLEPESDDDQSDF